MRHSLLVPRRLALLLLMCTMLVSINGCLFKSDPYSYGRVKLRVYNDGDDPITNVTVGHGDGTDMWPSIEPGDRKTTQFLLVAEKPLTLQYEHPTPGVVTREYKFHARREDAGIIDVRVDRLGVVDVRTRAKLKK